MKPNVFLYYFYHRDLSHTLLLLHFVAFFGIPLAAFGAGCAAVFPNNLALYLKDLKLLSLTKSASKLVASSLE